MNCLTQFFFVAKLRIVVLLRIFALLSFGCMPKKLSSLASSHGILSLNTEIYPLTL